VLVTRISIFLDDKHIYVRHIKGRLLNNQLIIIGYLVDYKVFYKIKIKIIFCYFGF